jgi:thioredoxin reductase (NADPH)
MRHARRQRSLWRVHTPERFPPRRRSALSAGVFQDSSAVAQCDVALDEKGFVRTGEVGGEKRHALETNRHGVVAIGDVRSGSVKRVAAAVGECAQVVSALHAFSHAMPSGKLNANILLRVRRTPRRSP